MRIPDQKAFGQAFHSLARIVNVPGWEAIIDAANESGQKPAVALRGPFEQPATN